MVGASSAMCPRRLVQRGCLPGEVCLGEVLVRRDSEGSPCLPDPSPLSTVSCPNSRSGLSSSLLLANLALILGPLHLCTWPGVKSGLTRLPGQLHLSVSPTAAKKTATPVCRGRWGVPRRRRDFSCGRSGVPQCLQATERAPGWPHVCEPGAASRPSQSEQHWAPTQGLFLLLDAAPALASIPFLDLPTPASPFPQAHTCSLTWVLHR